MVFPIPQLFLYFLCLTLFLLAKRVTFFKTSKSISPCRMSLFVIRSFFTSKCKHSHWTSLQEIAFEEVLRFSSKYVSIDWSILFKAFQFSPLALGWLWRPTWTTRWLYLGDDMWPIIVNIRTPHLNSKNQLLQKMHVYVSFCTIKLKNNGLVVSFPISFVSNHVFDTICRSFIGTKQISNIKHLMTFNIKREVVHVDTIILALRLTIKS